MTAEQIQLGKLVAELATNLHSELALGYFVGSFTSNSLAASHEIIRSGQSNLQVGQSNSGVDESNSGVIQAIS